MAGLEPFLPRIFHEKQEGSLCAQHALNNLLQGPYFTAVDLAAIAQDLDELEASYDDANNGKSTNMDDTGFFSVQVLEKALAVWGLRLVRWRSEEMRHLQDEPYTQLGFILNLELHWFALRRFGPLEPATNGHWFNLNSFLKGPEWVSRTYLGLVLQQAEQEGYSVFAVCPVDPSGDSLVRTDADELAGTLPQPTSAGTQHLNTSRTAARPTLGSSNVPGSVEGAEDEDLMLQAALQASMAGADHEIPDWLRDQANEAHTRQAGSGGPSRPGQESLAAGSFNLPGGNYGGMPGTFDEEAEDLDAAADPVAASTARNRAFMERMRREQEMAFRGALDDDIMQHAHRARQGAAGRAAGPALPQQYPDVAPPRRRRTAGEDDEENELQRALAASQAADEALATPGRPNRFAGLRGDNDNDDDDDEDAVMDDNDEEATMYRRAQELQQRRQPLAPIAPDSVAPRNRVYDDDDAELQAALRASLETVPDGFVLPPSPQAPLRRPPAPSSSTATEARHATPGPEPAAADEPVSSPPREVALTAEELRKKRLARFDWPAEISK